MTTPDETRRGMLQHVGREAYLIGTHPKCGHRGKVDRVEEVSGQPAMIVILENRQEYPVTDPGHIMFCIPPAVLSKQLEEIASLRKTIERLPHRFDCKFAQNVRGGYDHDVACTCGKDAAIASAKASLEPPK